MGGFIAFHITDAKHSDKKSFIEVTLDPKTKLINSFSDVGSFHFNACFRFQYDDLNKKRKNIEKH